jgi:hypothetical protein
VNGEQAGFLFAAGFRSICGHGFVLPTDLQFQTLDDAFEFNPIIFDQARMMTAKRTRPVQSIENAKSFVCWTGGDANWEF